MFYFIFFSIILVSFFGIDCIRTMHSILNDFTLHHANRIGQADAEVSKVRGIYIYIYIISGRDLPMNVLKTHPQQKQQKQQEQ